MLNGPPGAAPGARGRVVQVAVSDGGVPKRPVPSAHVTRTGLLGDRQRDLRHHGGPERAVCLLSLELIERLRAEGHPIAPGSTGENLTLAGLDWSALRPGARLLFAGGVELQVSGEAAPCPTIQRSFAGGGFERLSGKQHPGESRLYCRVLREGVVAEGEAVEVSGAG